PGGNAWMDARPKARQRAGGVQVRQPSGAALAAPQMLTRITWLPFTTLAVTAGTERSSSSSTVTCERVCHSIKHLLTARQLNCGQLCRGGVLLEQGGQDSVLLLLLEGSQHGIQLLLLQGSQQGVLLLPQGTQGGELLLALQAGQQ